MVELSHVPALDAVRGIAIALVLAVHSGNLLPGGALGVDLFFVLSGFLITSLLLTEWHQTGRIGFGPFYLRRARRLLPALTSMLLVVVVVTALADRSALRVALGEALVGLLYVANVVEAAGGTFQTAGLSPLWSLATEEQFYLLWPPLLGLLLVRRVPGRGILLGLVVTIAVVETWRIVLLTEGVSTERLWLAPDTHADPILIGCLAGIAFSFGLISSETVSRAPLTGLALIVAAMLVASLSWLDPATFVLLPVFAGACAIVVLACTMHPRSIFVRGLDQKPLRYLGRISYGLYLWHLPIFVAVGWVAGLPLSIAVAALSYRYLERPILRMGRRTSQQADRRRPRIARANAAQDAEVG